MSCVVAFYEIYQVAPRSILTNNSQMLGRQEDLLKLNDVGMIAAQPLVEDLSACCLDAACTHALSDGHVFLQ